MTNSSVRYTPADLKAAATALMARANAATPGSDEQHQPRFVVPAAADPPGQPPPISSANPADLTRGREPTGLSVRVLAAHSGAGASTVALALAAAAAQTGLRVRLIDAAAPTWSGLAAATHIEHGVVQGWRRGRRGETLSIERLATAVCTPNQVPTPNPEDPDAQPGVTVVDAGWSARELLAHPHCWLNTTGFTATVVVTQAHTSALGQLEVLLDELASHAVSLVVIGAKDWSGLELGATGLCTRELRETAVFLPRLRSPAPALGPEPLPKPLIGVGRAVFACVNHNHNHNHTDTDTDTDTGTGTGTGTGIQERS